MKGNKPYTFQLSVSALVIILSPLYLEVNGNSNIALCRDVIMSSVYDTKREGYKAVEGTQSSEWDTCTSTLSEANPWILIDLENTYNISSVYIYKRDCCPTRLRNLRFELGSTQDDLTLVHKFDGYVGTNRSFEFSSYFTGRYLRIWMEVADDYLTLCEVEVYGEIVPDTVINGGLTCWSDWTSCSQTCGTGFRSRTRSCTYPSPSNGGEDCIGILLETPACLETVCSGGINLAFGMNVTMSSVYNAGSPGSNAVNGIKTGIWEDGSCASTLEEGNPWLVVDLEDVYTVSAIIIVNRNIHRERLNNVHIELGPSLDSLTEIYYQEDAVEEDLKVGLDGSYSGQFVKIWIETTDYLTICEVEVYAEEISLPPTTTTVSSYNQPQYLGDTCDSTDECSPAVSGSVICSFNACTCYQGFTAFKNFACLQNKSSKTIRQTPFLIFVLFYLTVVYFPW